MKRVKQTGLPDLREKRDLSQEQLGQRVAKVLNLDWSNSVAQKRVSNWENGIAQPSTQHTKALAKALGVTQDQVSAALSQTTERSVFHNLAEESAEPSLIAICCTTKPRELHDVGILAAVQKGVASGKISVAMFVPGNRLASTDTDSSILNGYIASVRIGVADYYRCLTASHETAKEQVKIYQPSNDVFVPFPPMMSYHYLIAQRDHDTIQSKVYIWARTLQFDEIELVDSDHTTQTSVWQSYFEPIFTYWVREGKLPEGSGPWKTTVL